MNCWRLPGSLGTFALTISPIFTKCFAHANTGFVFFFQAEDGIRDYKVTGVQTCALPISRCGHLSRRLADSWTLYDNTSGLVGIGIGNIVSEPGRTRVGEWQPMAQSCPQIGRASCRERV